jgi:hypothetical protein
MNWNCFTVTASAGGRVVVAAAVVSVVAAASPLGSSESDSPQAPTSATAAKMAVSAGWGPALTGFCLIASA